ncbi:MAG: Rieske 2Fe-2S domain-containing protein [Caulobacteraceae bacterium]|nr:Rieske 2Fe-2S domain-containing protein [Caulobacteraceae bacterium]
MNPARPAPGLRLCALDEIADPGAKGFSWRVGEALFAGFVVRLGREVIGYVDRCPHAGTPLALNPDRYLTRESDLIFCSTHAALFRIGDGACVAGPCVGKALWRWPVVVADGEVRTA